MNTLTDSTTTTTLTPKEQCFITSLISKLYAEPGFSDVTPEDFFKEFTNKKVVAGLISSLTTKGVIWIDYEHENGRADLGEVHGTFLHLEEDYWYMHPEWKDGR